MSILAVDPETQDDCNGVPVNLVPLQVNLVPGLVTLGLTTEIQTADPLPMIPHQVETQFIASQPFPVSVSGLIPSLSAAQVPCWYRNCQYQAMATQTVREYPHQLGCQTLHYKTLPYGSRLLTFHLCRFFCRITSSGEF